MQTMSDRKRGGFLLLLFWLLLIGAFFFQILDLSVSDAEKDRQARLPISIRASSQADYSRDSNALRVQPVNENIFEQLIYDLQGTGDPQDRISTLEASLSMPVPTMTLNPQMPTSIAPPFTATSGIPRSVTSPATPSLAVTSTVVTPTSTVTLVSNSPTPVPPTATSIPPATKKPRPTTRPKPTRRP
ncbi:MAG: hypothetical protein QM730_26755 [Anaerolineales bacterium]